jgi:transcriptional regulator with XRE-family HTH domain
MGDEMPERIHFIVDWAKEHNLSQADISRQIDADRAIVSRWFNQGVMPKPEYLVKLGTLFGTTPQGMFHRPQDEALLKLFCVLTDEQKEQLVEMAKVMFRL